MPKVNGKDYPYTKQGIIEAEAARGEEAHKEGDDDCPHCEAKEKEDKAKESAPQIRRTKKSARPPSADDSSESQESEPRQKEFQTYITQLESIVKNEAVSKELMSLGESNQEHPLAGMGKMVATLIVQLDEKMGGELPEDMILPLAEHVTVMVGDMVGAKVGKEFSESELVPVGQFAVGELVKEYGVDESELQSQLEKMPKQSVINSANLASKLSGGEKMFHMEGGQ